MLVGGARALAVERAQAQAAEALERRAVGRRAPRLAHGGVDRHRERALVLVDARRGAVRRRALGLDARPVAHRAAGGGEVARLPERGRQQPQDGRVLRLGVARVDEPLRGEREVALGERVLGGGHEALDALGARVGLGEVDELQRARRHRAHADLEGDARPLLDVVVVAGEVDAVDAADAPLGIGEAARVAVHDRVVGDARGERVVLLAVGGVLAGALLGLVGALALLGARLARRGGGDLDGVAADLAAARVLGQALELVGRLVDRLEVALVLVLAPGRRDVGVPALRHPAPRELHGALVERRLQLEEQDRLLDVQELRHEPSTVPAGSSVDELFRHVVDRQPPRGDGEHHQRAHVVEVDPALEAEGGVAHELRRSGRAG